mmetsp:Transcript_26092/g.74803  ORF Transcript_26092/g.74803 Transcript_26092/m.74803 type:complete len:228 (+) Transcript_26092:1219-1902(+)
MRVSVNLHTEVRLPLVGDLIAPLSADEIQLASLEAQEAKPLRPHDASELPCRRLPAHQQHGGATSPRKGLPTLAQPLLSGIRGEAPTIARTGGKLRRNPPHRLRRVNLATCAAGIGEVPIVSLLRSRRQAREALPVDAVARADAENQQNHLGPENRPAVVRAQEAHFEWALVGVLDPGFPAIRPHAQQPPARRRLHGAVGRQILFEYRVIVSLAELERAHEVARVPR